MKRLVLILGLAAGGALAGALALPVRLTEHAPCRSLDEIEKELGRERIEGRPERWSDRWDIPTADEFFLIGKISGIWMTAAPRTGREYLQLRYSGFHPGSNYDIAMDSVWLFQAGTLGWLKTANPSRVSYVSDFSFETFPLELLPWDKGNFLDEETGSPARLDTVCSHSHDIATANPGGAHSIHEARIFLIRRAAAWNVEWT
jgi:hypothetical protein